MKKNFQGVLLSGIMLAMPCHAETASAEMSVSVLVPSGVNVNVEPIIFNLGNAGAGSAVSM